MPPTMRDDGAEMADTQPQSERTCRGAQFSSWRYPRPTRCELIASCVSHKDKRQKQKRSALFQGMLRGRQEHFQHRDFRQIGAACGLAEGDEAAVSSYLASDDGERGLLRSVGMPRVAASAACRILLSMAMLLIDPMASAVLSALTNSSSSLRRSREQAREK